MYIVLFLYLYIYCIFIIYIYIDVFSYVSYVNASKSAKQASRGGFSYITNYFLVM